MFGHAGDGNVHVNVTGVPLDAEAVTAAVFELVAAMHGSISAEHGIGTAKRALPASRAQPGRDRGLPRDQDRPRPDRDPEPERLVAGDRAGD